MEPSRSLSVDMKAALALVVAFIIYLIAGLVLALATGPFDIFAAASLVFIIPYAAFFYFGRKPKAWSYLGIAALSSVLMAVIPAAASMNTGDMSAVLDSLSTIAAVLFGLMALEGFKSYLELKA